MEDELRRKFDEIVARYELEPELRDIYVEGATDKNLVEWFLRQKGQQDFVVYEIDTVDIPAHRLFELGLSDGKQGRVIALALDMQSYLSEIPPHLTCIADRDFDWLLGKEYVCELLLFTDYSCLEMYLFNEIVIDKFLRLVVRVPHIKANEVLGRLSKVLEELFFLRATNEALTLGMKWLEGFGGCCKLKENEIQFNLKIFINKYLNKNNAMPQKQLFIAKLDELRKNEVVDLRYKIHKDDFIELLGWYIRPSLRKEIRNSYNAEILAGSLLGCIEVEHLAQEGLFQRLLARLGEQQ